ncbi:MAG TPA: hypothetical protein ENI87_12655, partial [bacterium]|nr:hypothetical protein [bacterium]
MSFEVGQVDGDAAPFSGPARSRPGVAGAFVLGTSASSSPVQGEQLSYSLRGKITETGKTGLHAFDQVQDLSLLLVPGRATSAVHNAMVSY